MRTSNYACFRGKAPFPPSPLHPRRPHLLELGQSRAPERSHPFAPQLANDGEATLRGEVFEEADLSDCKSATVGSTPTSASFYFHPRNSGKNRGFRGFFLGTPLISEWPVRCTGLHGNYRCCALSRHTKRHTVSRRFGRGLAVSAGRPLLLRCSVWTGCLHSLGLGGHLHMAPCFPTGTVKMNVRVAVALFPNNCAKSGIRYQHPSRRRVDTRSAAGPR